MMDFYSTKKYRIVNLVRNQITEVFENVIIIVF
jgi:hypothetical protein